MHQAFSGLEDNAIIHLPLCGDSILDLSPPICALGFSGGLSPIQLLSLKTDASTESWAVINYPISTPLFLTLNGKWTAFLRHLF